MKYVITVKYRYEHERFEVPCLKDIVVRHADCLATAKIQAVKQIVAAFPVISVDVIDCKESS